MRWLVSQTVHQSCPDHRDHFEAEDFKLWRILEIHKIQKGPDTAVMPEQLHFFPCCLVS